MGTDDEDFTWMVARANALIERGLRREAAIARAVDDGDERVRVRTRAEPAKSKWDHPRRLLTVTLGEAAKVSLLRPRRA